MNLVTGYPRSGTMFLATLLTKCGVDMPHEGIGKDGTVSWFQAGERGRVFAKNPDPYQFDKVIQVVRNPVHVLRSVHTFRPEVWTFFEANLGKSPSDDFLVRGMYTWIQWNRKIEGLNNYLWKFRIEDKLSHEHLFAVLGHDMPKRLPELSPKINSRDCDPITEEDLYKADRRLAEDVFWLAEQYGYSF